MNAISTCAPALEIINGQPTTLSNHVASYFKKLHKNVIRDIRNLVNTAPELGQLNFEPSSYINEQGKEQPCFRMDRKGFVLLAMGFTGPDALKFKMAYIDAFDKMEAELRNRQQVVVPSLITREMRKMIQSEVGKRAHALGVPFSVVWSALRSHYNIERYTEITVDQFDDAIKHIRTCCIQLPKQKELPLSIPDDKVLVSKDFIDAVQKVLYFYGYLAPDRFKKVYSTLKTLESPMAGTIASLYSEPRFFLAQINEELGKMGLAVRSA